MSLKDWFSDSILLIVLILAIVAILISVDALLHFVG